VRVDDIKIDVSGSESLSVKTSSSPLTATTMSVTSGVERSPAGTPEPVTSDDVPVQLADDAVADGVQSLEEAGGMHIVHGPNVQNFIKSKFIILSQFFRISFVCQLISYRVKSLRKNYDVYKYFFVNKMTHM